jgi:predicted glycoside hydrolase/deacetylase ChbG (UPF0249 family)
VFGTFYGQTDEGAPLPDHITVDALLGILRALPNRITELACHPGIGLDLVSMYGREREQEVRVLCDPRIRAAIVAQNITLCSFHNVPSNETNPR